MNVITIKEIFMNATNLIGMYSGKKLQEHILIRRLSLIIFQVFIYFTSKKVQNTIF